MTARYHAVVWIDHAKARVLHFSGEEADKVVIRPGHSVRDVHHGKRRTGHRVAEDRKYFEAVAKAVADAEAIVIVGPAGEKTEFAKFLAEAHPSARAHVEGVEAANHPSDGELLDFARRFVKAADRMRA